MAEETSEPAHPSPDSEEDGKQNLEASSGDNGIPTPAPDVTYDATILEDEHCPEGAKDCSENGDEQRSELESTAEREKVEEAVHPVERTEGDGREEEGEGGQSENEEWMDILGSGELKKKVLRPGGGVETRPSPQCCVTIRTEGKLDSGTVVDKYHSVPFTLGDGDVIQAWDLSVALMAIGEVAVIKTSPRFAYGKHGRSPDIPTNASITYELELLEVQEPVDFSKVSEEDLTALIDRKRLRGNELFQRKDFQLAINSYEKGLKLIESFTAERGTEAVPSTISDMHVRCLNNLAAAYLKEERYKESQEVCEKVLEKEPNNVKALYRCGKVLAIKGDLGPALKYLQRAVELSPDERAIQVELQKAQAKKERVEKEEKEMYKRMMGEGVPQKKTGSQNKRGSERDRWGPLPYLAVAGLVASIGMAIAYFFTQRQH